MRDFAILISLLSLLGTSHLSAIILTQHISPLASGIVAGCAATVAVVVWGWWVHKNSS